MAELLRMPEIAANTTEAVLASWPLPEGSSFARDDVVATVETAKAVVDVSAEQDGVLLRSLVPAGAEVEVGDPIALIGSPGEQVADVDAVLRDLGVVAQPASAPSAAQPPADPGAVEVPEAGTPDPSPTPAPAATANGDRHGRVFASPLARRLATEAGLAVADIEGSGPNGRVLRRDVERASTAAGAPGAPAVPPATGRQESGWTDVPHSRLRRLVASRLTESKQHAPHFYVRATVRVQRLLDLRAELNGTGAGETAEARVSVTDLLVKAVGRAHVMVPALNVTWGADAVRRYDAVDVGVAVATDNGLVTPVVRGVQDLSVTAVARTTRDLAERARAGELRQAELEGGTITVTNLGMNGTEEFAAIINPPQASILAVGATREEPVAVDGRLGVAAVMRLTLSVDHRPVDGVAAAEWLRALADLLEHPARILA